MKALSAALLLLVAPVVTAARSCTIADFTEDLSGQQCRGLCNVALDEQTNEACADACCDDADCAIWNLHPTSGCWIGNSNTCVAVSGWLGGRRDPSAPPPPPTASPDQCGPQDFPTDLTNAQCLGFDAAPGAPAGSADACVEACCDDDMCLHWNYSPSDGCWLSGKSNPKHVVYVSRIAHDGARSPSSRESQEPLDLLVVFSRK